MGNAFVGFVIILAFCFAGGLISSWITLRLMEPLHNATIKEEVQKSLNGTVTRIEYRLVNTSGTDRQCLVGDDIRMWNRFETSLEDARNKLQEKFGRKFKQEMESFLISMTKEMEKKTLALCTNITEDVNSSLRDVIKTKVDAIQRETRAMAQRQEEFDQRIGLVPQVMEIRGFMNIETFGPLLMMLGFVEMILMLSVCFLFSRRCQAHGLGAQPRNG